MTINDLATKSQRTQMKKMTRITRQMIAAALICASGGLAAKTLTVDAKGGAEFTSIDAAVAVAEHIAGDESKFSERMQKKASEIGMEKSSFGNASGLPHENNLMTSKELAILAKYIIDEYPEIYPMFATKTGAANGPRHIL